MGPRRRPVKTADVKPPVSDASNPAHAEAVHIRLSCRQRRRGPDPGEASPHGLITGPRGSTTLSDRRRSPPLLRRGRPDRSSLISSSKSSATYVLDREPAGFHRAPSVPSFFLRHKSWPIWSSPSPSPYFEMESTRPVSSLFHFFRTLSFSGWYAPCHPPQFSPLSLHPCTLESVERDYPTDSRPGGDPVSKNRRKLKSPAI